MIESLFLLIMLEVLRIVRFHTFYLFLFLFTFLQHHHHDIAFKPVAGFVGRHD